jgi:AcrR family transcriptional regulator
MGTENSSGSGSRPYHHGQLREALVVAGLSLARESGPEAVVLRAVSRAAGVSHNAAYRHFADHDDLMRAVCERCMRELALLMEKRVGEVPSTGSAVDDAWARLNALGASYVEFAVTEMGWFRTAFAVPASMHAFEPGEGTGDSGLGPYELLGQRLDELVAVGAMPSQRRPGAEYAAWSSVHGLSTLLTSGPLRELPEEERQRALHVVLGGTTRGLMR